MSELKKHDVPVQIVTLGSMIVKMPMPMGMIADINKIYDEKVSEMIPLNDGLAGKIKDEHKISDHLTDELKGIFKQAFEFYMTQIQKAEQYEVEPDRAWVNEMKAHEYNPFHYHTGIKSEVGLSSVLVLKRPDTYGEEITRKDNPHNGHLEFLGNDSSPIAVNQFRLDAQVGDFFIFPYTTLHGVYPFWGTDQARRTLSYNCDLIRKKPK
ncbi:MAG: hypothetical protein H8E55_05115 [Pelagibacterales bacterium]|nr:hypothetical protein [Pelagibacterales bacterium]